MKRILLVLAVLVLALVVGNEQARHRSLANETPASDSTQRIKEVKEVGGRPVVAVQLPNGHETKAIAGEVLVKLAPGAEQQFGAQAEPVGVPGTYTVKVSGDIAAETTRIKTLPGVTAAGPNYIVTKALTPNDPMYGPNQWDLPKIGAPGAWDETTGSGSLIVAHIDTGINPNHEDLTGRLWVNTAETAGNGIDDDGNGYIDDRNGFDFANNTTSGGLPVNDANGPADDEGHGTLTASVLGATANNNKGLAGVAWQPKIMALKALDTEGFGAMSDVAASIRYAAENGAKVVSMSLGAFGVTSDIATDDAIEYASTEGVTLVAASGNDGSSSVVSYPANHAKVIAVGATDTNDQRAGFSNAGASLALVAPGVSIAGSMGVVSQPGVPSLGTEGGGSQAAGTYRYAISATNANGETITSEPSSGNPNSDSIVVSAGQSVRMNWSSTFGASGYKIYRTAVNGAAGSYKLLDTVGNVTTYLDNGSKTLTSTNPPSRTSATLDSSYAVGSGTSLATPLVAGAAALVMSQNAALTPTQVKTMLTSSADKVAGMGANSWTSSYGSGRLNVGKALNALPAYAAQYITQTTPAVVLKGNQSTQVSVDFKNVGSQSWSSTGSNPIRLATSHPQDRGSGFASGWLASNRVGSFGGKVESDNSVTSTTTIAPGETARFTFTLRGPVAPPGGYNEFFQLVVEGVKWLDDVNLYWGITLQPPAPAYSATWVNQGTLPGMVSGGQSSTFVDFKNTGMTAWTSNGANPIHLGTANPRDRLSGYYSNGWKSYNRTGSFTGKVEQNGSVTNTTTIAPGETARFELTMTAPPVNVTTNVRQYMQPVIEGITWLEDWGVYWNALVTPRTYQYSWAGQVSPPATMQPGDTAPVSIDLTNTGTATWWGTSLNTVRLATSRPLDVGSPLANQTWVSPTRVKYAGKVVSGSLVASDAIAAGETARFTFEVKAPGGNGGLFRQYFQPVVENFSFLPDTGIYLETFVPSQNGPAYAYSYVGQSPYPSLTAGNEATLKLQLRNTGTATWNSTGANPVKLGTARPQDRGSGFMTSTGWVSSNRIKLTRNLSDGAKNVGGETTIAPGDIGEFEFAVSGNVPAGTYNEYFQPLAEGITWMADIGIMWRITVQKPIQVAISAQSSATLTGTGAITLRNEAGTTYGSVPAGTAITLSYNGSYAATYTGGSASSSSPIHADQAGDTVITVSALAENGSFNKFRGGLYIKNGSPGTFLINDIDLELYLRGLGEVPDSWPIEAIKAQTIAARTYAARKMASPQNSLFNMYDDTRDQVYNGYNNEAAKPNTVTAVLQTAGVGLWYGGSLVQAYYSSDSGGATENNENVWGGTAIPYLRGVSDPYQKPDVWSKTVANGTIQANFGHSGNIDQINILAFYPSGRVKTVQLVTSGGSTTNHTQTADNNRSDFTTRSSLINGLGRSGNDWVISGRGFGHGIGMAQWGAYNQALQGRSAAQILQFYYTGATLGQI